MKLAWVGGGGQEEEKRQSVRRMHVDNKNMTAGSDDLI